MRLFLHSEDGPRFIRIKRTANGIFSSVFRSFGLSAVVAAAAVLLGIAHERVDVARDLDLLLRAAGAVRLQVGTACAQQPHGLLRPTARRHPQIRPQY